MRPSFFQVVEALLAMHEALKEEVAAAQLVRETTWQQSGDELRVVALNIHDCQMVQFQAGLSLKRLTQCF